jgi:hypothetical protein
MAGDDTVYTSFLKIPEGMLFTSTYGYNGSPLARLLFGRELNKEEQADLVEAAHRYANLRMGQNKKSEWKR